MKLTPERWRSIEDLYHAAMEKPAGERAAFLEASTTDEGLRREVASMLGFAPSVLLQRSPWSKPASLGPYMVGEAIGAGGMGEVYKGLDTRLGRDVALKVLPEGMTDDPDRRARFIREAQSTSRLNHPNIVTVYDVGESEGRVYIAMEYVAGKTLADLIPRTGLRFALTLAYAIPVASALAKAHAEGIIHRDVKPGNIMVTAGGTVKVLDFGLAKLLQSPALESAPLAAKPETQSGVLMGTPAFMSPEQAEGKPLDARSDIFSFGAVLYEMATGQRAFHGDSMAATMAAVLHKTPEVPAKVPTSLQTVIERCLRKDPERRFQSMADLRVALLDLQEMGEEPAPTPRTPTRRRLPMTAFGVAALALAALGVVYFRERKPESAATHLTVSLPGTVVGVTFLALSPDGRTLVMKVVDKDSARSGLALRPLDSDQIRLLPDTAGARLPFWSPDGKKIAFTGLDDKLRVIPATGGPPELLCDGHEGGTWGADGVILTGTAKDQFMRCDAERGGCSALAGDPTLARRRPVFLPDGKHFLFSGRTAGRETGAANRTGIYVASLDDPGGKRLLADDSKAIYAQDAGGHGFLIFRRGEALVGQAFDPAAVTLSGDAFTIAEDVSRDLGLTVMASAAANGVLVYGTGRNQNVQLTWLDREGKVLSVDGPVRNQHGVALSPQGSRILITMGVGRDRDIWLRDVADGSESKFTSAPLGAEVGVWSPDGSVLAFGGGDGNLYRKDVSGGGKEELILKSGAPKNPSDWSRDGRYLIYTEVDEKTNADIWVLPDPGAIGGAGKPYPFQRTDAIESQAQISPDGKWIAYSSNESGANEVYVRPFPSGPSQWRVSAGGGDEPRWRSDGRELFYRGWGSPPRSRLMSVAVKAAASGSFAAGEPQPLFEHRVYTWIPPLNSWTYSPAPDGQRFLVLSKPEIQDTIHVLSNWTQMFRVKP